MHPGEGWKKRPAATPSAVYGQDSRVAGRPKLPKEGYPDADQFESPIGAPLGIPKIAREAAAEKFAWAADDGRQTFAMLEGVGTSDGGEGSWDVMFVRSTIDPDTKKAAPATIPRVMVRIDDDGNISFPRFP